MPLVTEHQYTSLPPWIQERYQKLVDRSSKLSEAPYQPYGYQRLAKIPEDIEKAHMLGRNVGVADPYFSYARQLASRSHANFPDQYQNYMNPYQQAVINRIAEEGNRNFQERILPSLEAKFVNLGQHGSSRHAKLAREAARDVQNEILANQSKALERGYQQGAQIFNADQARKLEASKEMSGLGGLAQAANLADITMLTDQGRYQQQQQQAGLDVSYNDWQRQQNYPYEAINQELGVLTGVPRPVATTHFEQTPGTPQTNLIGQIGQLATGLSGLRRFGMKKGGKVKAKSPKEAAFSVMNKKRRK